LINLLATLNNEDSPYMSIGAVKKTVYLSLMEIEKKWTMPISNGA